MTFSNPITDLLIVGVFPDGTFIAIDATTLGAPAIIFGTGDPSEVLHASIRTFYLGVPGQSILNVMGPGEAAGVQLTSGGAVILTGAGAQSVQPLNPYGAQWSSAAPQTIPNAAITTLTDYNVVLGHQPNGVGVAAGGVITPTEPGRWRHTMIGRFVAAAGGIRIAYGRNVSGVDEPLGQHGTPAAGQPAPFAVFWEDEYDGFSENVRFRVFQSSGAPLDFRMLRCTSEHLHFPDP